MDTIYIIAKYIHIVTVFISVSLFILRFYWSRTHTAYTQYHWVRTLPHLNDTILLVSGLVLVTSGHIYSLPGQGQWLNEKFFAVIIYILFGYIALGRHSLSIKIRWIALIGALGTLGIIIRLAIIKTPLLGMI